MQIPTKPDAANRRNLGGLRVASGATFAPEPRGHRMFHRRHINRGRAIVVGIAVVLTATVVPFVVSGVSAASTASAPAGGTIHFSLVDTSVNHNAPGKVLITGAFSDHGTSKGATLDLTKGTITGDISKLQALLSSRSFGTFYKASCSVSGVGKVAIPVVSGTGAYAGITGNLKVTVTDAAQGSLLKNGKCNEANNAPEVASQLIIAGSGKVS